MNAKKEEKIRVCFSPYSSNSLYNCLIWILLVLIWWSWIGGEGEGEGSMAPAATQAPRPALPSPGETPSGGREHGQEQASIAGPHHTGPFTVESGEGTLCSVL